MTIGAPRTGGAGGGLAFWALHVREDRSLDGSPGGDDSVSMHSAHTDAAPSAEPPAPEMSAMVASAGWFRENWLRTMFISAAVLVPCFWHPRIEAGDLGSHIYNAWLVQLIHRGQAPGLWVSWQTTNVLFDLMLSGLGSIFGFFAAERIAVATSILLFFWSAFALASALSRRASWSVLPCVAMFAYGWTFEQGLLNFYLSIALSLLALALVAAGRAAERALSFLLLPLMWLAQPFGVFFFLAAAAYLWMASRLKAREQLYLLAAAAIASLLLARSLVALFPSLPAGSLLERLHFNGSDQIVLYGVRYEWIAEPFLAFALLNLLADEVVRWTTGGSAAERASLWQSRRLPLQLYFLSVWTALLLPRAIRFPQYASLVGPINERVTSFCAVLLCCVLAALQPRRWHLPGFAALVAVFFSFLYQDTGKLNRMEQQAERYERILPSGQRILATIFPFVGSRVLSPHIVDRSCIGYCFSYGDYEPSSGQFRVRARPGNGIVLADYDSADAAASGEYVVQPGDLPVFQIYQCSLNMTELCMRELAAGEKNGRVGLHRTGP